jgi:SAM-dependent methyltransferase
MPASESELAKIQRSYFERAEVQRFHWTTRAPGFAETEDELLEPLLPSMESPCLEIGCGEGNNLVRLARRARCYGVDLFPSKLTFATRQLPEVRFAAADAHHIPFADSAFRSVFARDLLHHVADPSAVLAEMARVLSPGGALCLLEPNGLNPLVRLQTYLVPAEAGARASSVRRLAQLLHGLPFEDTAIETRLPLPLRRAVLHYEFGFPALGRSPLPRRTLAAAEGVLGRLLPRSLWSYVLVTARRASSASGSCP